MIDLKDAKLVLTPQQVAEEFAEMDSDDQARFFNRLAIVVASWKGADCTAQMQMVTDSKLLSVEGLAIMAAIGEAVPCAECAKKMVCGEFAALCAQVQEYCAVCFRAGCQGCSLDDAVPGTKPMVSNGG